MISSPIARGQRKPPNLVNDYSLGLIDCLWRERLVEHVFPLFGLLVSDKAKRRPVFIETVVETPFFVPAILVVVDVVICLRLCEMQLREILSTKFRSCTQGADEPH